jgi:cephalosporin hydroxylase
MNKFWRKIGRSVRRRAAIGHQIATQLAEPYLCRAFHSALNRKTENFAHVKWLGVPIWQNVLDLWTIQETLFEVKPGLLIECGTNRGGSSYFFAHLFDLMDHGHVVTIDIEKMHDLSHPRITYLVGDSVAPLVVAQVERLVHDVGGPVIVILDSDHRQPHVRRELETYARFVTPGSYLLVQDGVIDVLGMFARGRPGPLAATEQFLGVHAEFELDQERCDRFLITHHPKGWLRRKFAASGRQSEVRPKLRRAA